MLLGLFSLPNSPALINFNTGFNLIRAAGSLPTLASILLLLWYSSVFHSQSKCALTTPHISHLLFDRISRHESGIFVIFWSGPGVGDHTRESFAVPLPPICRICTMSAPFHCLPCARPRAA